jgi:hypothetical protein
MVSYSYFNLQMLQTVADGFLLLLQLAKVANCCRWFQSVASEGFGPRACCKLLQSVASCFNLLQTPDASDVSPLQPTRSIVFSLRPDIAIRPAFHGRARQ